MKNLMLKVVLVLATAAIGASAVSADVNCNPATPTKVQGIVGKACNVNGQPTNLPGCSPSDQKICDPTPGSTTFLQGILNTFLLAAGTVSLIFVMIGGFRYITSTGDASRIKSAKDTLLYAIIGLIVTVLAVPIAGFVINKVAGG